MQLVLGAYSKEEVNDKRGRLLVVTDQWPYDRKRDEIQEVGVIAR